MARFIHPQSPQRPVHTTAMKQLLGIDPKKDWPDFGIPCRPVNGIPVWVLSKEAAKRQGVFHRVRARCPDCNTEVSAGRLFQHRC